MTSRWEGELTDLKADHTGSLPPSYDTHHSDPLGADFASNTSSQVATSALLTRRNPYTNMESGETQMLSMLPDHDSMDR
jgi:hypothetical protein